MSLPRLTRSLVTTPEFQRRTDLLVPSEAMLDLPEKAVQFGTGALLRGFVDYFIDAANHRGQFNGRIVAIGSTGSGRDARVNEQDGLFTLAISGIEDGNAREERRIIASVSRAISARDDWAAVLECARNPEIEVVFSNTTEIGISLDEDDTAAMMPPRSFPGKLTAFLHARATAFEFDQSRGLVILPCELIEGNGDRLREIVRTLANRWNLEAKFLDWLASSVRFCNTLVDRIVPGTPGPERHAELEAQFGYHDELATACEVYRLFAIEGDAKLPARLGFAKADPGIIVTESIAPYRLRKVRLLNGTHSIMAPVGLLTGCETVLDAMQNETISRFARRAMLEEIVPTLDVPSAASFAREVLDRFANPSIRHALIDITLQATMKVRVRIVPSILEYTERTGRVPESLAFGFAAHLLFMRGDLQGDRTTAGRNVPADDSAPRFADAWKAAGADHSTLVRDIASDETLWGTDLTALPRFAESVTEHLEALDRDGAAAALDAHLSAVSSA